MSASVITITREETAELLPLEGRLGTYLRRLMARPAAQAARFFDGF